MTETKTAPLPTWQKAVRELLALALWIGALLKLFVFDFDLWIIARYAPWALWLLDYRFAFVVAVAAVIVAFWRANLFWRWVAYVLFYPLVLIFWRLPAFVYKRKSWTLGVALAALIVGGIRAFRPNFLLFCGFTLATIACAFARSGWFLAPGALLAFAVLVGMYWRAVAAAFKPTLDAFSTKTLDSVWTAVRTTFGAEPLPDVPPEDMTEAQRTNWTAGLQMAVLYNRACYFLASKIRDLKRSNLSAVMYIARLLALFLATVWTFFLMNFALLKAMPLQYTVHGAVNGFEMFYYSFNTLFSNSVARVAPSGAGSKVLAMGATGFLGLLFAVVVVFVVTSLQKSRDDAQMDATIQAIREHADGMESYVDQRFGMGIPEAIEALQKFRAGMIEWIYYVAPSYRPPEE